MSQESNTSRVQELEIEKEKMIEMLEPQRIQQVHVLEMHLLQAQTIARTKHKQTGCEATAVNVQKMEERITKIEKLVANLTQENFTLKEKLKRLCDT